MTEIAARDEQGLRGVAAAAHDLWFKPEDVVYDEAEERVSILLTADEKRRGFLGLEYYTPGETPAGQLIFDGIRRFVVLDEAETDAYEVSSIVAHPRPDGVRITVFGGAPLRIDMEAPRIAARFLGPEPT